MKRRTILIRGVAASLAVAAITTVTDGGIDLAGAQAPPPQMGIVQLVHVCPRGSFGCTNFNGRTCILTRSLGVTRTIPAGCGVVTLAGAKTLPTNDAVFIDNIARGSAAVHLTVNPEYSDPSPGGRIFITDDSEQCCLNSSGDAVQPCMQTNGETTVRQITGGLF